MKVKLPKVEWNCFSILKEELAEVVSTLLFHDILFSLTVEDRKATLTADDYQSLGDFSATRLENLFPQVESHRLWWEGDTNRGVKLTLHFFEGENPEYARLTFPRVVG